MSKHALKILGLGLGLAALPSASRAESVITGAGGDPNYTIILEPTVTQPSKDYTSIRFTPGHNMWLHAEGCVQTGGAGKTWKRYVDPQGPNSDRLYHGLVAVGGAISTLTAFSSLPFSGYWTNAFFIDSRVPESHLRLGYTDDNYSDNGYWSPDPGTNNQCLGVGNARVDTYRG